MIVTMTAKTASEYDDSRSAPVSSAVTVDPPLRYLPARDGVEFCEQRGRLAAAAGRTRVSREMDGIVGHNLAARSLTAYSSINRGSSR